MGITLPEVYQRHVEAGLRTEKTRHNYRWALKHWARLMGAIDVGLIDDDAVTYFVQSLAGEAFTPNTVRTVLRHVRACLNRCGARDVRNKKGLDLLERVPFSDVEVEAEDRFTNIATLSEIGALYRATPFMGYKPRSFKGAAENFWRFQLVTAFLCGLRTEDIMLLTRSQFLTDSQVDASEMLQHYGFVRQHAWPHGWLVYVPKKTKAKKKLPIVLPLHAVVAAHLARLDAPRLFVPDSLFGIADWRSVSSGYYAHAQRWSERAGLGRKLSLIHVRRASATMWNNYHGLGEYVLGHAPRGSASRVNAQYYDSCIGRVCEVLDQLPLPAEFGGEVKG